MVFTKTIDLDGQQVTFRASAAIPRIYRNRFHRDIYKDLRDLQKIVDGENPEVSSLDSFSLELFEDISRIMAKHADPAGVPDTPEEFSRLPMQSDFDKFQLNSAYKINCRN